MYFETVNISFLVIEIVRGRSQATLTKVCTLLTTYQPVDIMGGGDSFHTESPKEEALLLTMVSNLKSKYKREKVFQ